jgi:hypothetical protein
VTGAYVSGKEKVVANELVRRGYVVITIDMFDWGERRMLWMATRRLSGSARGFRRRARERAGESEGPSPSDILIVNAAPQGW